MIRPERINETSRALFFSDKACLFKGDTHNSSTPASPLHARGCIFMSLYQIPE